jgi:hypothetical protein
VRLATLLALLFLAATGIASAQKLVSPPQVAPAPAQSEPPSPSVRETEATAETKRQAAAEWWNRSLAVALFIATILQFCALVWQGKQLHRTVSLARQEFIATHRPRLRVRIVQTAPLQPEQAVRGSLVIVNVGEGDATVVNIGADIACRRDHAFDQPGLNITWAQEITEPTLKCGEHQTIPIVSAAPISRNAARLMGKSFRGGEPTLVLIDPPRRRAGTSTPHHLFQINDPTNATLTKTT